MLTIKPYVRIEQSATKNILIDHHSGEFYECSETALFLIQKMLKNTTREALIQALIDSYEITPKDAHAQVDYCVTTLSSLGMVDEQI